MQPISVVTAYYKISGCWNEESEIGQLMKEFFSCIITMVHQNSPNLEFWWEKIEGNLRRANTEPSIDFRRVNTEPS